MLDNVFLVFGFHICARSSQWILNIFSDEYWSIRSMFARSKHHSRLSNTGSTKWNVNVSPVERNETLSELFFPEFLHLTCEEHYFFFMYEYCVSLKVNLISLSSAFSRMICHTLCEFLGMFTCAYANSSVVIDNAYEMMRSKWSLCTHIKASG